MEHAVIAVPDVVQSCWVKFGLSQSLHHEMQSHVISSQSHGLS